jgi:hypothetical protein
MRNVLLLALFLCLPAARAATPDGTNAFLDMMRSMLNMFEMMQLYQDFKSGRNLPPPPPPGSGWPAPANATLPPFAPQSISQLDGAWASNNNLLFAIRNGLGRIYWAKDKYRDFKLEVLPPRLRMTDTKTGQSEEFDIAIQGDRMVLRDKEGRLALFRRLPLDK